MKRMTIGIMVTGAALTAWPAWAQAPKAVEQTIDIGKMTCKDLMAGNDADRDAGMAYFHGFLAGKKNAQTVNVKAVGALTDRVKDYCLSNPTATVMDAFQKSAK